MDITTLKVFQTVAELGSITKAAQILNFAQSNVTTKIQQLELQLGAPLFYRHNKGVILTPKGKTMLEYAEKIIHLIEESYKAMQDEEYPKGPLSIGAMETTAALRLPPILSKYHYEYPNVELTLVTGPTKQHVQAVLQYEVDGAFVSGPIEHPDLLQEKVFEEELVLITDTFHKPLSSIKDIQTRTMLVFRTGCSYRSKLHQLLSNEGVFPEKIMEFGALEAILGCVSAGLGISLLPRSVVEKQIDAGKLRLYPIPEPYSKVPTVFIRRKDTLVTTALQKFMDMFIKSAKLSNI